MIIEKDWGCCSTKYGIVTGRHVDKNLTFSWSLFNCSVCPPTFFSEDDLGIISSVFSSTPEDFLLNFFDSDMPNKEKKKKTTIKQDVKQESALTEIEKKLSHLSSSSPLIEICELLFSLKPYDFAPGFSGLNIFAPS